MPSILPLMQMRFAMWIFFILAAKYYNFRCPRCKLHPQGFTNSQCGESDSYKISIKILRTKRILILSHMIYLKMSQILGLFYNWWCFIKSRYWKVSFCWWYSCFQLDLHFLGLVQSINCKIISLQLMNKMGEILFL